MCKRAAQHDQRQAQPPRPVPHSRRVDRIALRGGERAAHRRDRRHARERARQTRARHCRLAHARLLARAQPASARAPGLAASQGGASGRLLLVLLVQVVAERDQHGHALLPLHRLPPRHPVAQEDQEVSRRAAAHLHAARVCARARADGERVRSRQRGRVRRRRVGELVCGGVERPRQAVGRVCGGSGERLSSRARQVRACRDDATHRRRHARASAECGGRRVERRLVALVAIRRHHVERLVCLLFVGRLDVHLQRSQASAASTTTTIALQIVPPQATRS